MFKEKVPVFWQLGARIFWEKTKQKYNINVYRNR